ncbi:A-kinase anchor protein 9 isoform X2 [Girardinichthys multiradiatus]|uniref:A-kinase anchor protein 9 isoform X2 n=1 Tax=Girardinichthys multiradiatus TaxID=208333 RepID=UPI001FAE17F9|nr:A-kinase anchor protein 9 isoform X2 [Girardinichthys multiradiatus]
MDTGREDSFVTGQDAYLGNKMFRLTITKLCRFRLAEYRQRKAHADSQKKQKKKKKKKPSEDSEGDSQGRVEVEPDPSVGEEGEREEVQGERLDKSHKGSGETPTTEFTFTKTLKSGETIRHDQTYKIEPESEVSTTAEDYSSEVNGCHDEMSENLMMPSKDFIWEEVETLQEQTEGRTVQEMEDALAAKTQALEELSQELEEIRSAFGAEGMQQLQDFEAALKQRDGIITQLTSNLQQARKEKDEIMKEFLALTEKSQELQIQFQQLQAGEALRNTSHSSTAVDLLQARQQLVQYQQQLEEMSVEVREQEEKSRKQLQLISHLQQKLSEVEMSGRRSEESFAQRINEKELLTAEQEKVILSQEESRRKAEEEFAQTMKDKHQFISEQTAIIKEHEQSLTLLRQELVRAGRTREEKIINDSAEKDLIIAEKDRVISERDSSLIQLKDELKNSEKHLHELQLEVALKESDLEKCLDELGSTKSELLSCKGQIESYKLELEKEQKELESCKGDLATFRHKEKMSSNEIKQLMGTVEDLQKRCHRGSMSESDTIQRMQEETLRKLELLRAELDEMYGQQIVQMKHELNLQHAARMQQMTEQHQVEVELLKADHLSQSSNLSKGEVETLNARIRELLVALEQSEATCNEARHELSQVVQEKSKLQVKIKDLLHDLSAARQEVEQVSTRLTSQETTQGDLQRLQETIHTLRNELSAAQEAALEAETKHESEITNYKIKLEMLEREKDAVLDRMAESQEAELERLRTQLLFSHEEELTNLREDLQRESFLKTENLLNEAAVRHEKALDELHVTYAQQLDLLQKEKTSYASERNELLHQIHGLKEDLKLTLQSSKADQLVQQLQELQVELEELKKGGQERVRMQNEMQLLLKQTEVLENQKNEREQKLKVNEQEKETLIKSNNTLREEMESRRLIMEKLTVQKNQFQQQLVELCEEIEKQKTTFSFAEKNFEVNYQELKDEYTCLAEAKTQLEERSLRDTLEFEAKIARLLSEIRELQEQNRDIETEEAKSKGHAVRDAMEKLDVTLSEKKNLADRLSDVTGQLMVTETKVRQLEEDLVKAREGNSEVIAKNKSLLKQLEKSEQKKTLEVEEQTVEAVSSSEDHHNQIQSLQEEIKALQARLRAAEAERDGVLQTLELHRLVHTPSPAAAHSSGEGPVEGRSLPHKPASSGSSRRKRRHRSKQERKAGSAASDDRDERLKEEEERAKSAAEEEMLPQTQSRVMSRSPERAGKEDSADGYQGDGDRDYINKAVSRQGIGCHTERVECQGAEEEEETSEHDEWRLQMEAQRISLSQIHAAQLELLQEETDTCTRSLDLKLQDLRHQSGQGGRKISKYMIEAVSEECSEIIRSFQKIFGKEFLERVNTAGLPLISEEGPAASESTSIVQEARELYSNLWQVTERIQHEHERLSQLQALLRSDGNKISELQMAYDELKINSEKQVSDLNVQLASISLSSSRDLGEQSGESASASVELQRLKAEAQVKQLQLEESHRQEMERLRGHYQQQAAETEERYATELFVLQQRLQETTGAQTYYSLSSASESSCEGMEERREELKEQTEDGVSEGSEGLRHSARLSGLTAQLQALRNALHHKYNQEVAALKEQHSSELRRLREEREHWEDRGEIKLDLNGVNGAGSSMESLGAAGQVLVEERLHQEMVEEEVAKAIVQMSVEFAQQTELARIKKSASQTSTSMQTQMDDEEVDGEVEEQTPRASPPAGVWLEEPEREKLERELEERNTEIRKLKVELQKTKFEQALKKRDDDEKQDGEGEEDSDHTPVTGRLKISKQDDGESSDKDTERNLPCEANKKLSQVLVDVLKTTAAAEETLGLHMQRLLEASAGVQPPESTTQAETCHSDDAETCQSRETGANTRLWSGKLEVEEGLEMSRQMMDRLLLGAESQLWNEEYFLGISGRLQIAVEKMLMTITDTTNQLEHARMTQTELMRESFRHNQEITDLLQKQEELQERVTEEARAREQLALELHRAEGLIDGYTGERAALEEQLRQKEELQLSLEQELQVTGSRLHELEQERLQMLEERELVSRQQEAMREEAGPRELCLVEAAMVAAPEADLLEETEKLMKEKVEVQRQAEKENTDLLKQVKQLEDELEEQVNRVIELEHSQKTETGDLQQQIQALEKQLEKNKKFLDEQAVDREHERDFFQQEIQKLEQQLKNPQKLQIGSEQRNKEVDGVILKVEQLNTQLKEKADWCSELLLGSEQLRRELGERDEEIEKLEGRIRELEQALLASAESLEKVEQKKQHASITETRHSTLEAQLQTEREALERKEKEICNLEEQLEQFREELENKSEEVQQLHMQLEIQRKEISSQQQFVETRDSMLQVMEERDKEIALLNEQISKLQYMETASDNKAIDAREEQIKELESQVECLRSEQDRLKKDKEEELDQLNAVIEKLQQELANIEQKQPAEEEEDAKGELESSAWGPTKEEYDKMKQKMDVATKELDALKAEHGKHLETYLRLKQSAEALAETENLDSAESELEEALREKTAGLVVLQAEVQALEQSAASRLEELGLRIQELEDLVDEKDSEMNRCLLKVSTLEENLREKVAEALVSQATLEAFQQQQQMRSESSKQQQELQKHPASAVHEFGDFGIPQMDFSSMSQTKQAPRGKVVHLTQKLRDLEAGLSGMQKDQELQKQLLSSSEEEVLEYERRLAVLMDLLSQMKAGSHQRTAPSVEASSAEQQDVSELLQELQEVREEASVTKEHLQSFQESCSRLKQELHEKTVTVERLQDQLQTMSTSAEEETKMSELEGRLIEAQTEAASAKEELSSCRESLDKLQELLQEREMTIAHLKGELFQVKAAEDGADMTGLLQELEEAKREAASTKEELNLSRKHHEKLQEDIQDREVSLSKLREEFQEMRRYVDVSKEELTKYQQHNEKLQEDVQTREVSLSEVREELQEMRRYVDVSKEELTKYQQHNEKLQEDVQTREVSLSEVREELQEMRRNVDVSKEELTKYQQHNEKLQEDVQTCEVSLSEVREELQEMRRNVDVTKEELRSYKQQNEKLLEELRIQELSISRLKEELQEAQTALMKTSESVPPSPSPSPSPSLSPQPAFSGSLTSTSQPKRKGGKQPAAKGGAAKEKPSLSRKNSGPSTKSSPSPHQRPQVNSSSDQHHDATTDSFTQTEPFQMTDLSQSAAKEQIEEVIGEFQEKIIQMQELHAAEILDMEARHISESENLRRDTQALEDECKGLKAVIDKLCSTEVPPSRQDRPASQFKDGYTSDSSSDYSQRTGFDLPSLQQEFRTTPEGARRETDDPLPDRIKTLLREVHQEGMQVLSLSELPLSEGEQGGQFNVEGWVKERDALLATVQSLKGLITQLQTHSQSQTSGGGADWRAELLDAVRQVFVRERSVLKSALYSQLDLLETSDAIVHLNLLERRLAEQDAHHREAMGSLHIADRSSLISEIRQLRGQLEQLHQSAQPGLSLAADRSAKEQRGGATDGAAEADRLILEELKAELSQTKLELETTLKAQHKHLKELDTLRAEVSQKAVEVDVLNDQLTEERKRSRDLQWTVEKERCQSGRDKESKREELEDLQLALVEQKAHVDRLTQSLQQEQQASSQLSQQAEEDRLGLHRRLQEVQVQLETERAKVLEMSSALGRERELRTGVFSDGAPSNEESAHEDGREPEAEGSLLERLQRELDDKHTQVVHLLGQVEAQRLEVVRIEEELTLANQKSRRDQDGLQEARAHLERLMVQMSKVQQQLDGELEKRKSLEEEKERLEERMHQLGARKESGPQSAVGPSEHNDRTKDWVLQQKSGNAQSASTSASPQMEGSPADLPGGPHHGPWRTVDRIVEKLHLVSSKIRCMASKALGRSTAEVDSEELSWVQSSVDEVINMLQQSPGLPSISESVSLMAGGSSSSSNNLMERLLRQNAELTGFVSRLTEEKNDLRNHTLRLEGELRRNRQAGAGSGDNPSKRDVSKADSAGMLLSKEREAWTQEKLHLEKALHLSQSQLARLRGEIRSDTLREITGPEADNSALKRMYGKYLRAESFRKALIYQKKYLLLLLGGFQECEEATLSLLSRMGGRPSLSSLESFSHRHRGLTRFRSAVRVSIALSRMRFLVKRWHKATGMSSTVSCGISKNGTGSDVRHSGYLHPGSVDVYRDGGGGGGGVSSSRGRSGRESPRSGVSCSHHRFHMAADHGALTCSHLQSYDPDRALTDYISRLEALQRRLGSVTSGASSYTQLHFGLRR